MKGCRGRFRLGCSLVKSFTRSRALLGTQFDLSKLASAGLSDSAGAYFSLVMPSTYRQSDRET